MYCMSESAASWPGCVAGVSLDGALRANQVSTSLAETLATSLRAVATLEVDLFRLAGISLHCVSSCIQHVLGKTYTRVHRKILASFLWLAIKSNPFAPKKKKRNADAVPRIHQICSPIIAQLFVGTKTPTCYETLQQKQMAPIVRSISLVSPASPRRRGRPSLS